MRSKEFAEAVPKPVIIKDSRFGLRRLPSSPNEIPHIFVEMDPGRGPNGEHQS